MFVARVWIELNMQKGGRERRKKENPQETRVICLHENICGLVCVCVFDPIVDFIVFE